MSEIQSEDCIVEKNNIKISIIPTSIQAFPKLKALALDQMNKNLIEKTKDYLLSKNKIGLIKWTKINDKCLTGKFKIMKLGWMTLHVEQPSPTGEKVALHSDTYPTFFVFNSVWFFLCPGVLCTALLFSPGFQVVIPAILTHYFVSRYVCKKIFVQIAKEVQSFS